MLISRTEDMTRLCEKTFTPKFSSFLTEGEAALAVKYLEFIGWEKYLLYGGYENAARVMMGIFPGYDEPQENDFPIKRVKLTGRNIGALTHRDFLGSLMALGITRSSVGDIVCLDDRVYAMLTESAAALAVSQITRIGKEGVKCVLCEDESIVREDRFSEIGGTVASLRLDAVLGTVLRLSREKAALLIRSGAVSADHRITENVSMQLTEGVVLSVKGYGRFILSEVGGKTKKDRIHITVKKYL